MYLQKKSAAIFTALFCMLAMQQLLTAQNWPSYEGDDQANDPTFDNSSVWHKNMELILPFKSPDTGPFNSELFSIANIHYKDDTENKWGQFIIYETGEYNFKGKGANKTEKENNYMGVSRVQLIDITDPRNPAVALQIFIKTDPDSNLADNMEYANRNDYYILRNTAIWTVRTTDTGHTFLAIHVNEPNGVKVVKDDPFTTEIDETTYSRVLIVDLTEALTKVEGDSTTNKIIIEDPTERESAYLYGASSTEYSDIYLGYIPRDDVYFIRYNVDWFTGDTVSLKTQIHTITCDPLTSVLSINPLQHTEFNGQVLENENYDPGEPDHPFKNPKYLEVSDRHGYVDCYLMKSIPTHTNFDSTAAFVIPTRIETSTGIPICVDVVINSVTHPTSPHEARADAIKKWDDVADDFDFDINGELQYEDEKFLLYVAAFRSGGELADINPEGGAMIFEIDYSSGTSNAAVTQKQAWVYDADRDSPTSRLSTFTDTSGSVFNSRSTHSVDAIHINHKTNLFVSANEFASPFIRLDTNDNYYEDFDEDFGVNIQTKSYMGADWPAFWGYDSDSDPPSASSGAYYYEDARKLGCYLKIWGSDEQHQIIIGNGNNPKNQSANTGSQIGSYDTYEIWPNPGDSPAINYSLNGRNATLKNEDVLSYTDTDTSNAYYLNANNQDSAQPGLNSSHHFNTVYAATGILPDDEKDAQGNYLTGDELYKLRRELYVANWTAGARVIDLKDYIRDNEDSDANEDDWEPKKVYERAYFDFFPTLKYKSKDRYFSYLKHKSEEGEKYRLQLSFIFPNYFHGIWDILPDVYNADYSSFRTNFYPDESFIYALGRVGKQARWLKNGDFLILRYFRDEIGGVISGYSSTVSGFQEVNLQGEFKVQREVEIAENAVVTILPGKEGEPGIFESTAFNVGDNGVKTIIVKGILNISFPAGDNDGTSIAINVPVEVKDGGKLVIYKIRDDKTEPVIFNRTVEIDSGGTFEINSSSYVAFNKKVWVDGKLYVLGEENKTVTIVGGLIPGKKLPYFNNLRNWLSGITVDGRYISSSSDNFVKLRYSEFKSIPVVILNSYGFIRKAYYCDFLDSTQYNQYGFPISLKGSPIVKIINTKYDTELKDSKEWARIWNCRFSDETDLSSFVKPIEISGPSGNTNKVHRVGLQVNNLRLFDLKSCDFNQLLIGLSTEKVVQGFINNSEFTKCNIGSMCMRSKVDECNNTFDKCVIGSVFNRAFQSNIFNNDFETVQQGVNLLLSGDQFFYGNTFDYYSYGIDIRNSVAWLANYPYPPIICPDSDPETPKYYILGRNEFVYPENPSQVSEFTMLSDAYDIHLKYLPGNTVLKCGKNDFASYSDYHIYWDNIYGQQLIDGSYNDFNPNSTPRTSTYVTVTGEPFNVSEQPDSFCGPLLSCVDEDCDIISSGGGGGWPIDLVIERIDLREETSSDTVEMFYDISRTGMFNENVTSYVRMSYASQALLTGSVLDSNNTIFDTLLVDYNSIVYNTSLTNEERNNGRYLKGQVFERLFMLDSGSTTYDEILENTDSPTDSMVVKWKQLEIDAFQTDTTYGEIFDSLMCIYHQTVAADLLLQEAPGGSKISVHDNYEDWDNTDIPEEELAIKLDQNSPNPFADLTEIQYFLSETAWAKLTLMNINGKIVANLIDKYVRGGWHTLIVNGSGLSTGAYILMLESKGKAVTKIINKIK